MYRGSNDSDISKKKSNEDASKPVEKAIEIGPEVTDFVAMIREELENGKLSPEQYLMSLDNGMTYTFKDY